MSALKEGDRVRVKEREVTSNDMKNGLYFPHFSGLVGTIEKIQNESEATINVEIDSLPSSIADRHYEVEDDMRQKWLDGLSDEARNRLSESAKEFHLKYAILAQISDLEPMKGSPSRKAVRPKEEAPSSKAVTTQDLDSAEEAFLQEMLQRAKKK